QRRCRLEAPSCTWRLLMQWESRLARSPQVEHLRQMRSLLGQLDPGHALHPPDDLLNPRKRLQDLVYLPSPVRVHLVGQELRIAPDHRQRIVDLMRRRGGQARDIPQGVPFQYRRLGLLAVRDVTGDQRCPDDLSLSVPDRRHRDGHVDALPVLPHPYSLVVVVPLSPSDPLDDLWQLVLRDRGPDWPLSEDLASRVPVEPRGAGVPARDHGVERHTDDRVVRGVHDRRGESQRGLGMAPLLDDVVSGSATIATKGPDPPTALRGTLG